MYFSTRSVNLEIIPEYAKYLSKKGVNGVLGTNMLLNNVFNTYPYLFD